MAWLIAYDIASARRWRRVHRRLREVATKLQYSLFWFDGDRTALEALLSQLRGHIHPRNDDLRVYAMPADARASLLGQKPWALGVATPAKRRFDAPLHTTIRSVPRTRRSSR